MKLKQAKCLKQYINNLSTIKICVYSVDNFVCLYIITMMTDLHFWGECKKTLERDLPVEEYSTWIAPLTLEQNNGSNPLSYSVLAPNKFISDWVEDNYGPTIKERLSAITSNRDLNLNFEIFVDYHEKQPADNAPQEPLKLDEINTTPSPGPLKSNLIEHFTFDSFVEGKSNHIALAASRQIGDGLKNSYNPLFIYGGVGPVSYTHLRAHETR